MYRNLKDRNNQYNDHDLAVHIACKKFEELYPNEMQPEWLKYCMSMKTARNQNKNWIIKMVLLPKTKLRPNQYWQWEDDGIPVLMEVDPVTKKEYVVICGGPAMDEEVFFETEVDLVKGVTKVLTNIDPNKLDETKYEMNIH